MINRVALPNDGLLHVPELALSLLGNVDADVELIDDGPNDVQITRADCPVDQDLADAVGRESDLEGLLGQLVLRVILRGVGQRLRRNRRVHARRGEAHLREIIWERSAGLAEIYGAGSGEKRRRFRAPCRPASDRWTI